MKHLWRIARYEYQRNVFKKSFLLMILGMPAMIAFSICLGVFLEASEDNPRPVGYVDLAGVCDPIASSSEMGAAWTQKYPDPVMIIPFAGEEPARAALAAGDIQMYYLLPADYRAARAVAEGELLQGIGNVAFDGGGRDGKFFGDLPVGIAETVQGDELLLAGGESFPISVGVCFQGGGDFVGIPAAFLRELVNDLGQSIELAISLPRLGF